MDVRIEAGEAGARRAEGVAVVIDVFRAFTVSACALAGGARECLLVRTVEEALKLARDIPGAVVSAEVGGRPVAGIPISNSPTLIAATDLRDRVLVQRSSAGTQAAAAAAESAQRVLAASLVVASATARRLQELRPPVVTLVASGEPDHLEDLECAGLLRRLVQQEEPQAGGALARIRESERYRALASGAVPGFPSTDLDLALDVDRFDFAMEVGRRGRLLVLRRCDA